MRSATRRHATAPTRQALAYAQVARAARIARIYTRGDALPALCHAVEGKCGAARLHAGCIQHHLAVWAIPVPGAVAPGGVEGGVVFLRLWCGCFHRDGETEECACLSAARRCKAG